MTAFKKWRTESGLLAVGEAKLEVKWVVTVLRQLAGDMAMWRGSWVS